ncbi:hypothetical protein GC194_09440 [bacterium]|nr:hypothetical protein [bacterium]
MKQLLFATLGVIFIALSCTRGDDIGPASKTEKIASIVAKTVFDRDATESKFVPEDQYLLQTTEFNENGYPTLDVSSRNDKNELEISKEETRYDGKGNILTTNRYSRGKRQVYIIYSYQNDHITTIEHHDVTGLEEFTTEYTYMADKSYESNSYLNSDTSKLFESSSFNPKGLLIEQRKYFFPGMNREVFKYNDANLLISTIIYNDNNEVLSETTYEYNSNLLKTKESTYTKGTLTNENIYAYDQNDNIVKLESKGDGSEYHAETYQYVYDQYENWTNRKTFSGNIQVQETQRDIVYR